MQDTQSHALPPNLTTTAVFHILGCSTIQGRVTMPPPSMLCTRDPVHLLSSVSLHSACSITLFPHWQRSGCTSSYLDTALSPLGPGFPASYSQPEKTFPCLDLSLLLLNSSWWPAGRAQILCGCCAQTQFSPTAQPTPPHISHPSSLFPTSWMELPLSPPPPFPLFLVPEGSPSLLSCHLLI